MFEELLNKNHVVVVKSDKYKKKKFKINNTSVFQVISRVFRLLGVTFLFVMFQIAFFLLVQKIGTHFPELWVLESFIIIAFGFYIYGGLRSKKSLTLKIFKVASSFLVCLLLLGVLLAVMLWFDSLISLKIILGLLLVYYLLNLALFVKEKRIKLAKTKLKSTLIIVGILTASMGSLLVISMNPEFVVIDPKSEPEMIFWCGSNQLPEEQEILDLCKQNKIAFMPTIREKMVGNEEYMNIYKSLINASIDLHFAIGGSKFYANLDNAHEFPSIYAKIRQWFITEGIMNNTHIVSFSIDAEPSNKYLKELRNQTLFDGLRTGCNRYPSEIEKEKATYALKNFTDAIKMDGKQCGMIQGSRFLDDTDGDGDYSLFTRNVYSLPVGWDFTVTMLYRTNRIQMDESEKSPPEFYAKSLAVFYGAIVEGTKFTTSLLSFYQNIALEQESRTGHTNNRYIFIGNFKREFKHTTYIKEKQFYDDLDICRHFNLDKVFLYDLKGFISRYGWEEINKIGEHIQKKENWTLEYMRYKSLTFLAFYCGLILIDILAPLERDLSKGGE
ncbi:MAG: hypothetical protein GF353_28250 [Candidatus Lokiarchaeota archaeon]|nr:hypothetical protein [Candidatus Lokiarchaeota archaeon]